MSEEALIWFIIKLHLQDKRNCSKFQIKQTGYNCTGHAA